MQLKGHSLYDEDDCGGLESFDSVPGVLLRAKTRLRASDRIGKEKGAGAVEEELGFECRLLDGLDFIYSCSMM